MLDQINIIAEANDMFKGSESLNEEAYNILVRTLYKSAKKTSTVKGML